MAAVKISILILAYSLIGLLVLSECSFIKPGKNVPRVGRSNEADGPFDHMMGYVIKTIPSKNIPRMGRRNYDAENRFDIPKPYQTQGENIEYLGGQSIPQYYVEQMNGPTDVFEGMMEEAENVM